MPAPHFRRIFLATVLVALWHGSVAHAQSVADGFDPGANGLVTALAVQPDGKILVGGQFSLMGGGGTGLTSRSRIARLNADGSLDSSFNPEAGSTVFAIVVQPDGKILVGGSFPSFGPGSGILRSRIGRLNADGSVDATFNPGADNDVRAIVLQPDGKIVVGGFFTTLGGGGTGTTARKWIGRLNSDGSLDTGFNPGASSDTPQPGDGVYSLALQADGKILVGGQFTGLGGGTGTTIRRYFGRLNADGSVDASFNPGANFPVFALALQADRKILLGGAFGGVGGGSGTTVRRCIARVNTDGSVDTTFDPGADNSILAMVVQPDGKILVTGPFTGLGGGTGTTPRSHVGRLNADGSVDTFDPGTNGGGNTAAAMAVQPDGKILIGGDFTTLGGGGSGNTARNRIGRLYPDGSLDADFDPGTNCTVFAIALQPDGKILIGGGFTLVGGGSTGSTSRNRIARLTPAGLVDASFTPGVDDDVFAIAVQPDGKILIGGRFTSFGAGTPKSYIARLNADGTLDSAFAPELDAYVNSIVLQPDGKMLISGEFSMVGGVSRSRIARLNSDGLLDTSFTASANAEVKPIAVQPDGKILIGGDFTMIGTTGRNRIARLNADGSIDSSFTAGFDSTVYAIALQPDGKILVGGAFFNFSSTSPPTARDQLARLHADGTLDVNFAFGLDSQDAHTLALQPNGQIVIGGEAGLLLRLNGNGTRDTTFLPFANDAVWGLAVQPDGKVLVGGAFTNVSSIFPRGGIARISNPSLAYQSLTLTNSNTRVSWMRSDTGPEVERVTFESSADGSTYTALGSGSRLAAGWELTGLSLVPGVRYVRARGYYGAGKYNGSGSIAESVRNVFVGCEAITLSPASLPGGTFIVGYTPIAITQSGGVGTATFAVTSGALPPGMTLSSAGVLSGTPTNGGTFTFTVTATAGGCQGSRIYSLTIACTYILSPVNREVTAGGGNSNVTITTGASCGWTASSNASWLHPTASGTGTTMVAVLVDPNKTAVARTGQVTIQGQTTTFTQLGATLTATAAGSNPALSGNARYLAFEAPDGSLVPSDVNGARDIFVRDRITDAVVRVSVTTSGEPANGDSFDPALNFTGRYVVFESDATNLVPGDTNGFRDVFMRDRDADGNGTFDEPGGVSTILISRSGSGAPGRGASVAPAISAGGDYVAFASDAPNLVFFDTNGVRDVFVRTQPTGATVQVTRVSVGPGDAGANAASNHPSITADGRYVAFESDATNLMAADTNGVTDVFVRDRTAGTTTRVSVGPGDSQATARSVAPAIASNGGLVVFTSEAALLPGDTNGQPDIYGHPPSGGATTRISVGSGDLQAVGSNTSASVSADGRYIAFASTAPNLSSLDTNNVEDVYVRDRTAGQVRLVLFASQIGNGRSFDPSISADGLTVSFATEATLPASMTGLISGAGTAPGPQAAVEGPVPSASFSPDHGPENTETPVQITGPNIRAISSVSFGPIAVRPQFVGESLLVTAPARAAGTVDVTVVSGITQGIRIGSFTYDAAGTRTECTFAVQSASQAFPSGGGSITGSVTAPDGCVWTPAATLVDSWITVTPAVPAPVNGSAALTVSAQPNPNPTQRSANVLVAGQTMSFSQSGQGCTYAVDQPSNRLREVPAAAGTDSGVHITTGPGCAWTTTSSVPWLQASGGAGSASVEFSVEANPSSFNRTGTLTVQGVAVQVTQLGVAAPAACSYTLGAPSNVIGVAGGTAVITLTTPAVDGGCPWNAKSEADWLTIEAPTSGTGSAVITARAATTNSGGERRGIVDVAGQKVTVVQAGLKAGLPFGIVDTPAQNATGLAGSIPVTGWALDDKGVVSVEIYRETVPGEPGARCRPLDPASPTCLLIGPAVFVRGSRPDVQALYPSMPNSDRAGWGYLLLSNQLPNQGNGTFRLIFLVRDTDNTIDPATGTLPELNRLTVSFTNSTAVTPFGGIDTPGQGETIQGTVYNNFGWTLTPLPKTIPKSGATIHVFVDSVDIGSPVYDLPRSDIAAIFPSFNNSAGPVGLLTFDTTVIADGVHTIAWVVTDDAGAAEGIGSRFFRVQNGTGLFGTPTAGLAMAAADADVTTVPLSAAQVRVGHGFAASPSTPVTPDRRGTRHVIVRALHVVRLDLGSAAGATYEGHAMTVGGLAPLPAGSTFDAGAGTFAWQLGPGFVGVYDLLFVRTLDGVRDRIPVRIVVEPYERAAAAPVIVDPPAQETAVPFRVTGSVTSGTARQIHEVVVYAYPADGGAPVLIGRTTAPAAPRDAGAPFGGQFARTPFAIDVSDLLPGTYDLLVVGRSGIAGDLDGATSVRTVTVR